MEMKKIHESSTDDQASSALHNGHSNSIGQAQMQRHNFKQSASILEPVYKLVGIDTAPTSKEVGTLVLLGVMVILFIISITGCFIMWFTEYYDNSFTSKLILANNSLAADYWANPPVNTKLKVHIFNYTNIDRFLNGLDEKIKVEDIGPLTYDERSTKVNVKFNKNFTVTYNEHRSYKFLPNESTVDQSVDVIIPNVPLLTASIEVDNMSGFKKMLAVSGINALNLQPFKKMPANQFLWGYHDELITILRKFTAAQLPEKFGMLMNRNGTSRDTMQIHTGEDNIQKLALISEFNYKPELDFWSTSKCNEIDGSDGSQFPPNLMNKRQKLEVFIQALCRKMPLQFEKEVNMFEDVEVWRYRTQMNIFSNPDENPENQCYCQGNECLPSGVFNGTLCYDGAPIFPSFPHFFSGNPVLYELFEGIEPTAEKHQTYADIHPRLAFPIDGASRIQINAAVHKGSLLGKKLERLHEGLILPVLWIEITSSELSEEMRTLLYHSTFSANVIQMALKYGTLLTCVTSFALIVAGFYYLAKMREDSLKIPDGDIEEHETLNKFKAAAEI